MIYAATGHRPKKLGGYTATAHHKLLGFAQIQILHFNPTTLLCGMALGWDQAMAEAAIAYGIPFVAACPCPNQEKPWPFKSQDKYRWLLSKAREVVMVSPSYSDAAMQKRNEWMVDRCDQVLALFDGTAGGTKNCVDYAGTKGKYVHNLWDEWCKQ